MGLIVVIIYNDYDIDDVLLDEPCMFEGKLPLYPIKLKDKKNFYKYAMFILYSAEHYKIDEDEKSILLTALTTYMGLLNGGKHSDNKEELKALFNVAIGHFVDLFKIITRGQILKLSYDQTDNRYIFVNENNISVITDWNFNKIRHIILKQNIMFEPFVYDDPDDAHWAEKAKRARQKQNKDFGEWEKLNIVSCGKQVSYDYIRDNYNILQLEADFNRFIRNKAVDDVNAWRKVCDEKTAKTLPKIGYSDSIFKDLYKNPEESLWKDADNSELLKNMQTLKK